MIWEEIIGEMGKQSTVTTRWGWIMTLPQDLYGFKNLDQAD